MDTYPMSVTAENVKRLLDYVDVVEHVEQYVSTRSGEEIDRLLDIVDYNEYSMPVGVEWDTTSNSPNLRRIDINGHTITPNTSFFDHHQIWGGMWTCVRDRTTGKITYGTNARGDGLTIDGTVGDVLVRVPVGRTSYTVDGDFRYIHMIPYVPNDTRYKINPAGVQRGGVERPFIFVGAKEAYGYLDPNDSKFKLGSASGKQPITGEVAYTDLPNSGRLTMDDAENYANNIGAGFGITNIHTWSYLGWLMILEYGTFNLQLPSALGRGVVDLDSGTGFAGKLTGADDVDLAANTATNGTGIGIGVDGKTSIKWRNIENPYGNVAEYAIGINASNVDNTYKIISRNGTSAPTLSSTLSSGTYETGTGVLPSTPGAFISNIQAEELGALALIPSAVDGSSSTYLCDLYTASSANPGLCVVGGSWYKNDYAGVAYKSFGPSVSFSNPSAGCRIEYIPQT